MLQSIHHLCRAIASRDLGDTPLYIVPQSTLPEHLAATTTSLGFTTPCLDLYARESIPNYRGCGACMAINDRALAENNPSDFVETITRGIAIHELAHILERPYLFRERGNVSPAKLLFESLTVAAELEALADEPTDNEPPLFVGHEARFTRAFLHLAWRADRLGAAVPINVVCAGWRYGMSPAYRYLESLGDEPVQCADWLIKDILATPAPIAFRQLWTTDYCAWFDSTPQSPRRTA